MSPFCYSRLLAFAAASLAVTVTLVALPQASQEPDGPRIVERTIRKIGEASPDDGLQVFQFKFKKLQIFDPVSGQKAKKLLTNVDYDAVALISIPFAGDYPIIAQFEFGKGEDFVFFTDTLNFIEGGLFEVTTTVTVPDPGKWAYSEVYGGNRSKTTKFKAL